MKPLTLQINLSPGDLDYAALTVPRLLAAHPSAAERLLVVDVCRPQRTAIVDPDRRFPEPAFGERCARIVGFAEDLRRGGKVDRVEVLRPGEPRFAEWRRSYLRPWLRETHDYGGCALMAYIAAFALCRTRWLLHYDADMLLAQAPGRDWAESAVSLVEADPEIIAATPRPCPPAPGLDAPTRQERLPVRAGAAGWLNQWFSSRCYLFDCERLRACLPLVQGRLLWETLLAKARRRGYPRSPEIMLFRRMRACRRWRLILRDPECWLLHPACKDSAWRAALPRLIELVADGRFPDAQGGGPDLRLECWHDLLAHDA